MDQEKRRTVIRLLETPIFKIINNNKIKAERTTFSGNIFVDTRTSPVHREIIWEGRPLSRIRYEKGLVCFLFALAPQPEKDEREVSAYSWCMLVCLAGRRLKLKTKKFSGSEVLVLRTPVWAGVRKVARQLKPRKCGLCSQGTNSYVQRQTSLRVSSGRKDDSCKKITVSKIPECVSTGRRLRQSIRLGATLATA